MAKVTFIDHDGTEHEVDIDPGQSLMEGAVWAGVRGIYADCGGDGGCATCQVYVDEAWRSKIEEKTNKERSTLRFAFKPAENSRLSCFITMREDLEGLVLRMPERQF